MTIGEALVAEFTKRFGTGAFQTSGLTGEVAVFPAVHAAVGAVVVHDNGCEAVVSVGSITHGHFDEPGRPIEEAAPIVAERVANFLEALFSERVLLWSESSLGAGGWVWLDDGEETRALSGRKTFTWLRAVE